MKRLGFVLAGGMGKRMGGLRPKVLYEVDGEPMVVRALSALRLGGAHRLVAVLSHRCDEVAAALPSDVELVIQARPRGTGSAIVDARHCITDDNTAVIVGYGDMPWLNPDSVSRLLEAIEDGADAAVLTFEFDDPPHFGRIVRDGAGAFVDIVEYKDCTPEQRASGELNAGMFAFRSGPLLTAIDRLDDNNAAGELYLTDVPGKIVAAGGRVACVPAERIEETLGVNDPPHLHFANQLSALRQCEELVAVADIFYAEATAEEPG
ncbi:MAG: NTP transferase domain-containing protein [Myxococcota bacterium]